MRQPNKRVTINLNEVAFAIYKKLLRHKNFGWMSKWVSDQLVEHYYKDFEATILKEILLEKTKERNKMDDEIVRLAKQIKKVKK